jgi:hypothetical protein
MDDPPHAREGFGCERTFQHAVTGAHADLVVARIRKHLPIDEHDAVSGAGPEWPDQISRACGNERGSIGERDVLDEEAYGGAVRAGRARHGFEGEAILAHAERGLGGLRGIAQVECATVDPDPLEPMRCDVLADRVRRDVPAAESLDACADRGRPVRRGAVRDGGAGGNGARRTCGEGSGPEHRLARAHGIDPGLLLDARAVRRLSGNQRRQVLLPAGAQHLAPHRVQPAADR